MVQRKREEKKKRFSAKRQRVAELSSFLGRDHLGDEADDGVGGLLGVHLCKQVAHVVRSAALFPRHEPEQPAAQH